MDKDLELFNSLAQKLLQAEQAEPVTPYLPPEDLNRVLDLSLKENPIDESQFGEAMENLVMHTPRTASKAFFNQLFGGRNSKATLGDLMAVMLNQSMYTYKVGGPQIAVEQEIITRLCEMIGYDEHAGGAIAPGGSMTNMMGMLMARDQFHLDIRMNGVQTTMVAYTSKESHYSLGKNASFTGVGRNNLRIVDTNEYGEMLPEHLEELIKKDLKAGIYPFMINATAGTTVLGAFDPINELADIAEKYNIWLHVDGALGGSVIFSEQYRKLLGDIHRADSFTLNAHKMLGTPLSCSLVFAKDKQHLYDSFANDADYLYQTGTDDLNPGKTSIQCGRRNDALKLWCMWKAEGTCGLAGRVDHEFDLAEKARYYIKSNPDYTLYYDKPSVTVCFNYKDIPADVLCNALYEHGELMVGYGSFRDDRFVRLAIVNSNNTHQDIQNFFTKLEQFVVTHEAQLLAATK